MALVELKTWIDDLPDDVMANLDAYVEELLRFNKTINLISPGTIPKLESLHVADSILGYRAILSELTPGRPIYDLGSGNGFPGVVFGILSPELKVFLVERDLRKAEFLKHTAALLNLSNVSVLNQEIVELGSEVVDQAVCRALAPLSKALLMFRAVFKLGGRFYHFKSDSWSKEIADLPTQTFSAWKTSLVGTYKLPKSEKVNAVVRTERIG